MAKNSTEDPQGQSGEKPEKAGHGPKPKTVTIEVNDKPVDVDERELTGVEIKAAAIAQGVQIQPNFALYLDRANGTSEPVANDQLTRVHPHMSFSALAPDDNS